MTTPVLQFQDVSKDFDSQTLLSSVSFTLFRGERLVIMGPSGQGKSVILRLIAGLEAPSSGEIFIEGESLGHVAASKRQELILKQGMLFQKNALFDSKNVFENVAFPLREVSDLPEKEIEMKVDSFLEAVGLLSSKKLYPSEISGGMQKRLGIARALILDPEILLLDDPTAGLDPITGRKIVNLILKLQKEKNSTFLAITNEVKRAFQLGTKLAFVAGGKFVETGTPEQTWESSNPRVHQFIRGELEGPLTESM